LHGFRPLPHQFSAVVRVLKGLDQEGSNLSLGVSVLGYDMIPKMSKYLPEYPAFALGFSALDLKFEARTWEEKAT